MSKKKEELTFITTTVFALGLFINWLGKQLTKLTKYFPFSLIPDSWYLHYYNRDIAHASDTLIFASFKTNVYFHITSVEKDDNYIFIEGNFYEKYSNKQVNNYLKFIENKYLKGNVSLRKNEDNSIFIFNKEVVNSKLRN
ncbi:MAG: hypothetical protein BWY78_00498 [Alphaproteobacteria bacterium ADurb.Bin438]|nr:MAG: hypothetical protein BWY78_00498 [Alphaproteobacteria bacterium ADurb.Bin438]